MRRSNGSSFRSAAALARHRQQLLQQCDDSPNHSISSAPGAIETAGASTESITSSREEPAAFCCLEHAVAAGSAPLMPPSLRFELGDSSLVSSLSSQKKIQGHSTSVTSKTEIPDCSHEGRNCWRQDKNTHAAADDDGHSISQEENPSVPTSIKDDFKADSINTNSTGDAQASNNRRRRIVESLRQTFARKAASASSASIGTDKYSFSTLNLRSRPTRHNNRNRHHHRMSLLGRVMVAKTRFVRRLGAGSASREDLRRRYGRYPPDFHSFLYHGFRPLSWWGLFCGLFPLFIHDSSKDVIKGSVMTTNDDVDEEKNANAQDTEGSRQSHEPPPAQRGILDMKMSSVKLKCTWRSPHLMYCWVLIAFASYLTARTVKKYTDPSEDCFEYYDNNLTMSTPMTKFDRYVFITTDIIGIPSALITLLCFAFHFRKMANYFNEWQRFETGVHYIASSMERFAKKALNATYVVGAFVFLVFPFLFSIKMATDPATGCGRNYWDMFCAVSRKLLRVLGAHFVDAFFLYLTLSVSSCFGALKQEILREFRAETGSNACLLLRRISQARRTYLELCRFAEMISELFTPQLLFTVIFLTYFCIATLYLAVVLASFGGHKLEIAVYAFVVVEVTVRIVVCASAGHALSAKAEEIQKILQHLNTSTWPREAQKQLESFVISTISLGAPEITASGFFSVRRPLCTAIFSQILTCFVILIEFRLIS